MGINTKLFIGSIGFFVLYPGVGIALGVFFTLYAAWAAKSFTLISFLTIMVVPFLIATVSGFLLGDGWGNVGLIPAYLMSWYAVTCMVMAPFGIEIPTFYVSRDEAETFVGNPFLVFVPAFMFLGAMFTTWVGKPVGVFVRDEVNDARKQSA